MDFNGTQFAEDPFEDIEQSQFRYTDHDAALQYVNLLFSIINFVIALCAIIMDILLIYAICKFKRLKTTVNRYIMHYAIFNILYFLSAPGFHIVYGFLFHYDHVILLCLVIQVEDVCLLFSFLFASALSFDWLIMVLKPHLGLKIKNIYKYLVPAIYIVVCLKFLIQSGLCVADINDMASFHLFVIYCLFLLIILVIDFLYVRYRKSIPLVNNVYSLTVANIILLVWLPMAIWSFMFHLVHFGGIGELILWYTEFIPTCLSSSSSIIITLVLLNRNKHFRQAFSKMFRRSVRDYSNEDGENLDESEAQENEVNSNVVYNNSTTSVKI